MLRLLLLLYPRSFRATLGLEALEMLRTDLREAREAGGFFFVVSALRLIGDFALQGILRRLDMVTSASEGLWSGWSQDLRHAVRASLRHPMFAIVSIFSLAIGIAVNGIMFSITDSLLLKDIPGVAEPDRVLEIGTVQTGSPRFQSWSYLDFEDFRREAPLEHTVFYNMGAVSLLEEDGASQALAMFSTSGYFETLGVELALGRTFTSGEEVGRETSRVAILSHRSWSELFDEDPDVLGRTVRINSDTYTVIGVTPAEFTGHMFGLYPALWLPITQDPEALADPDRRLRARDTGWGSVMGRMGPDTEIGEVNASLATIFAALEAEHPESNRDRSARAAQAGMAPADARGRMMAAFGLISLLALLVLAATCANVAGMLLARASAKEQELAIRAALGSPRARLVRHLMTEAIIVFSIGGIAGIWLAHRALQVDPNVFLPVEVPIQMDFSMDWRLGLFGVLLTGTAGLIFGLLPALQVTNYTVSATLRDPAGGGGTRASRLRRIFVGAQIAITVLLLGASGLSLRSVLEWADLDTGFDVEDIYVVSFDLARDGYDVERGTLFIEDLVAHLRLQPEIEDATVATEIPLDGSSSSAPIWPDGQTTERWIRGHFGSIQPGYFEALGIELLEGRTFGSGDRADTERVAIVNQSLAREAWPDGNALGRTVEFGLDPVVYTVVGVVEDTQADGITERHTPQVFSVLAQSYSGDVHLAVRRMPGVENFNGILRRAILAVDPSLALSQTRSMAQMSKVMLLPHRIMATLASSLGALALLLSALGLYGVIAFAVTRRSREIGVRIALGARRTTVIGGIVGSGLLLALPGTAVGLLLSLALGQVMQGILPVSALDPITYGATLTILISVVITACLAPAWRAAAIHPVEALRSD